MKEINLNNYEAWFLDYLEGTLDKAGEEALMDFLEQHPGLKRELFAYDDELALTPAMEAGLNKASLKGPKAEDFDTLLVSYIEGQLNERDKKKTESLIAANQSIARDFSLYKKTILEADTGIVFPNKQKLKKGNGKIVQLYWYSAAAAAACLILFALNFNFNPEEGVQDNMADTPVDTLNLEKPLEQIEATTVEVIESLADNNIKPVRNPGKKPGKQSTLVPEIPERIQNRPGKIERNLPGAPEKKAFPEEVIYAQLSGPDQEEISVSPQPSDGFLTPKELIAYKIREFGGNKEKENNPKPITISIWDLADAGANGFAKITGKDLRISRTDNEQVSAFGIISEKFEFSKSSSKGN